MRELILLLKKDLWVLKNNILLILKNPLRLLPYSFFVLYLFFLLNMGKKSNADKSKDEILEMQEEFRNAGLSAKLDDFSIYGLLTFLALVLVIWQCYAATKKNVSFFKMADVNFLFVAPTRPPQLLIYYMIRSLIPTLGIAALFTVYSSGQLIGMLDLGALDVLHILIGVTLLIFILSPIKFLIYTLNTRYQRPDRIRQVLWGVILLLALAVGIPGLLAETFYIGMFSWLGSPYFEFFPFIGWSRGLISYLFEQNLWRSAAFLAVYTLSFIGLVRLVIHFAGDYYEDVLETTKANEETQEKVKTRQAQSESAGALAAKKKVDVPLFGTGAQAIYWRNYVGNIRTDYHPYFGLYSFGIVAISWIIALGSRFLDWDHQILYFYIFAIYAIYGLGGLGKTNVGDLKKHYFYLMPATWNAKMWNLLKIDVLQCLLVGGLMAVGAVFIADLSFFLLLYVPLAMVALYLSVLSISLITQIGVKESWDRKFIKSGITLALFSFGLMPAFGIAFFLYIISNQAVYGFLGMGVWLCMVALILLNAASEMIEKRELHEVG